SVRFCAAAFAAPGDLPVRRLDPVIANQVDDAPGLPNPEVLTSGQPKHLGRDGGPPTGPPHRTLVDGNPLLRPRYGVGVSARSRSSCFSSAQSADGIMRRNAATFCLTCSGDR